MSHIASLLEQVSRCQHCAASLPLPPRPVVRVTAAARLLIIGQAPGLRVHNTGIPWNDPSGDRLRSWLCLDREQFYDDPRIAIMPMGFCYPGKGRSGDLPPRSECAPRWHELLLAQMPALALVLLIGQYAQRYYLPNPRLSLTERVRHHNDDERFFSLPHPSPRNQRWLKKNPWFEAQTLPLLRRRVAPLLENV